MMIIHGNWPQLAYQRAAHMEKASVERERRERTIVGPRFVGIKLGKPSPQRHHRHPHPFRLQPRRRWRRRYQLLRSPPHFDLPLSIRSPPRSRSLPLRYFWCNFSLVFCGLVLLGLEGFWCIDRLLAMAGFLAVHPALVWRLTLCFFFGLVDWVGMIECSTFSGFWFFVGGNWGVDLAVCWFVCRLLLMAKLFVWEWLRLNMFFAFASSFFTIFFLFLGQFFWKIVVCCNKILPNCTFFGHKDGVFFHNNVIQLSDSCIDACHPSIWL